MYSVSDKNEMFNFQKPGPLGFLWSAIWFVTIEWSVLKPAEMSVCVRLHVGLWLIKKKSNRQWISGFLLRHVYLRMSGWDTLHASTKSNFVACSLIALTSFAWVLARPPFLSFSRLSTKSKSPPKIISSQRKSCKWPKKLSKKAGSSSFGA